MVGEKGVVAEGDPEEVLVVFLADVFDGSLFGNKNGTKVEGFVHFFLKRGKMFKKEKEN